MSSRIGGRRGECLEGWKQFSVYVGIVCWKRDKGMLGEGGLGEGGVLERRDTE